MTQRLLVVRFPNGSWSHGGKPDDPDYEECEKYMVETDKSKALSPKEAIRMAQDSRRKQIRCGGPVGQL